MGESKMNLFSSNRTFFNCGLVFAIAVWLLTADSSAWGQDSEIAGCETSTQADYSEGFSEDDFDFTNVGIGNNGDILFLETGQQGINPDKIVVPFEQELFANFIFEGAGYKSDFGWILKEDAVDEDGDFKGWRNIPKNKKHPLFFHINKEGSGYLDNRSRMDGYSNRSADTEAALEAWEDGSGVPFITDGDGRLDLGDMRKSLGTFAGGTEIVFWLSANKNYDSDTENGIYYTKTLWNPDTYNSQVPGNNDPNWISRNPDTFYKHYQLGVAGGESWRVDAGWMTQTAIDNLRIHFGIKLEEDDVYTMKLTKGEKYPHVIVGAPANDANQWILGWEDLKGGGDTDHNDLVFRIERKTGGTAALKPKKAISPSDPNSYYTAATIEVWDVIPSSGACEGKTDIKYFISIDGGANWEEVRDWNYVEETDASGNSINGTNISDSWVPGTPEATHRTARIDFAAKGKSGRDLLWRAELLSENEACVPEIIDVELIGTVANNALFSRASPMIQTNVVYSGSYETPAVDWPVEERWLRGHLVATRIYDPAAPKNKNGSATATEELWNAGEQLASLGPSKRNILFNEVDFTKVTDEVVANGNGSDVAFSGTLENTIIQAGTLKISDGREEFTDSHTDKLSGNWGGTGRINRFTGEYTITFDDPPPRGKAIKASYTYYSSGGLEKFTTAKVDFESLGLESEFIHGEGYRHDFNNDGEVNASDGDYVVQYTQGYFLDNGSLKEKTWPLGAIDHSAPAVAVPPGLPEWYFPIKDTPEGASYKAYRDSMHDRRTVVYVGSRSGMLHAFDGGAFRWGDNELTDVKENRGYFEWTGGTSDTADYGTGEELWAYIPSNLLSRLKNNITGMGDPAYVDASPAFAEVNVNGGWRTVVLSAQGNGGDSIFCLDVTDPYNPVFMWEFVDPDLYRSSSSPAVGKIGRIRVGGDITWAAFFVSGKTSCTQDERDADEVYCYPSVFIIDIADGSVVDRIFLDSVEKGKGGIPSGQPALIDYDNNSVIDRLYVGTDKGYMYKVNLPDTGSGGTPADCVINSGFADPNQGIYGSPTVVKDGGDVRVFYGTGDSPYARDGDQSGTTRYNFFAFLDADGKGECGAATLDWFKELPAGHRVFASAFAAAGKIYFGTSTADTEDPCEGFGLEGESSDDGRLYMLNQEDGTAANSDLPYVETGDIRTTPVVEDEHVYFKNPSAAPDATDAGVQSIGDGQYNNETIMQRNPDTSESWWREAF
jgi:hypothetical protein